MNFCLARAGEPFPLAPIGCLVEELDRALHEESGLLGLSQLSADVRELEAAARVDERARLALAVYTYGIAGVVAAMAASLGGLGSERCFSGRNSRRSTQCDRSLCGCAEVCEDGILGYRTGGDAP